MRLASAGRLRRLAVGCLAIAVVLLATALAITVNVAWYGLATLSEGRSAYDLWQLVNAQVNRTNPPIVDKDLYWPDARLLEKHWADIADEWRRISAHYGTSVPRFDDVDPVQSFAQGTWRILLLQFLYTDVPGNAKLCPRTMQLLHRCRGVRNAFFSVLEPGTTLPPHHGPSSAVLRYHLGVSVPEPEQCTLTVENEVVHWREGEGFVWDDRYLHSATNQGTKPRVVLFLDVDRPDMPWSTYLLDWMVTRLIQSKPYFQYILTSSHTPLKELPELNL